MPCEVIINRVMGVGGGVALNELTSEADVEKIDNEELQPRKGNEVGAKRYALPARLWHIMTMTLPT